jgi:hypothetical protein
MLKQDEVAPRSGCLVLLSDAFGTHPMWCCRIIVWNARSQIDQWNKLPQLIKTAPPLASNTFEVPCTGAQATYSRVGAALCPYDIVDCTRHFLFYCMTVLFSRRTFFCETGNTEQSRKLHCSILFDWRDQRFHSRASSSLASARANRLFVLVYAVEPPVGASLRLEWGSVATAGCRVLAKEASEPVGS